MNFSWRSDDPNDLTINSGDLVSWPVRLAWANDAKTKLKWQVEDSTWMPREGQGVAVAVGYHPHGVVSKFLAISGTDFRVAETTEGPMLLPATGRHGKVLFPLDGVGFYQDEMQAALQGAHGFSHWTTGPDPVPHSNNPELDCDYGADSKPGGPRTITLTYPKAAWYATIGA